MMVRLLRSMASAPTERAVSRSEEHTSELQSHHDLVCRLLLEKKKNIRIKTLPFRSKRPPSTSSEHPLPPTSPVSVANSPPSQPRTTPSYYTSTPHDTVTLLST